MTLVPVLSSICVSTLTGPASDPLDQMQGDSHDAVQFVATRPPPSTTNQVTCLAEESWVEDFDSGVAPSQEYVREGRDTSTSSSNQIAPARVAA